jgi:hypothetical protein
MPNLYCSMFCAVNNLKKRSKVKFINHTDTLFLSYAPFFARERSWNSNTETGLNAAIGRQKQLKEFSVFFVITQLWVYQVFPFFFLKYLSTKFTFFISAPGLFLSSLSCLHWKMRFAFILVLLSFWFNRRPGAFWP